MESPRVLRPACKPFTFMTMLCLEFTERPRVLRPACKPFPFMTMSCLEFTERPRALRPACKPFPFMTMSCLEFTERPRALCPASCCFTRFLFLSGFCWVAGVLLLLPLPLPCTHSLLLVRQQAPGQGFPGGSAVRNPLPVQEMRVRPLSRAVSLENRMTAHSSILAWEIPWAEEPVLGT